MKRVIRVGGVHEPFNLPFIHAFERDAFSSLGVEVVFSDFDGGTGALVEALETGTIDFATLLTEGAVTAIANGSGVRIHSAFTDSPLRWGIHIAAKADQTKVDELKGKKFAISRPGSGSELMAWILADQQGWKLKSKQFVVVGGINGAVTALPKRKAHIFLWERFVTAPLVKQGIFKRVGEIATPWPAFVTATGPGVAEDNPALVDEIVTITLKHAAELKADTDGTIDLIVDRYGMDRRSARTWLKGVDWPASKHIDREVLASAMDRMASLGRIETVVDIDHLLP